MTEIAAQLAPGIFRLVLPLGIHGVPSVNGYLLVDDAGDTLVDCGVYAPLPERPGPDGTEAVESGLAACGRSLATLSRLVVTHAHIDHFGIAGELVRRTGADLWMHAETDRDVAKYRDAHSAVDRRTVMLADHGLYGQLLEAASGGLMDWLPVMPTIADATTRLRGGEQFYAGGRRWAVVHTPGHSLGHVCLWCERDGILCSGDHLLRPMAPPVTFERGFDPDPMGSYLGSLAKVVDMAPRLVLPGHGEPFADGARRATAIADAKRRRLDRALSLVEAGDTTATDLTAAMFSPALTGFQLHFAMAEVLAYLAYHEARGAAERVRRSDGVFVWRAVPGTA